MTPIPSTTMSGGLPMLTPYASQMAYPPAYMARNRAETSQDWRRTALERLQQLAENFLRHVEAGVFPGGCFFASVAAEMDTRSGPVRDVAVQLTEDWLRQLEAAVRDAQAEGAIDPSEDAAQLAFELDSYLLLANAQFVASQDSRPIERARRALAHRLSAALPTS
jgi:AcrR family transcriptional regulator